MYILHPTIIGHNDTFYFDSYWVAYLLHYQSVINVAIDYDHNMR